MICIVCMYNIWLRIEILHSYGMLAHIQYIVCVNRCVWFMSGNWMERCSYGQSDKFSACHHGNYAIIPSCKRHFIRKWKEMHFYRCATDNKDAILSFFVSSSPFDAASTSNLLLHFWCQQINNSAITNTATVCYHASQNPFDWCLMIQSTKFIMFVLKYRFSCNHF